MRLFGLIGYPLSHSFSEKYFNEKFKKEGIPDCSYKLFPLSEIKLFPALTEKYPALLGVNVTIPYKESIIPFLQSLDEVASETGAVNTVKIIRSDKQVTLTGFNTDVFGFEESLMGIKNIKKAIILGTGGASKAVAYVLKKMKVSVLFVSRNPAGRETIGYGDLSRELILEHNFIINATPLGMYPDVEKCPPIPYEFIGKEHFLYDLVYNPAETGFLTRGKKQGAGTKNGSLMLKLQSEKSWEIWSGF